MYNPIGKHICVRNNTDEERRRLEKEEEEEEEEKKRKTHELLDDGIKGTHYDVIGMLNLMFNCPGAVIGKHEINVYFAVYR
jgi:hypothetical protein